MKKRFFCSLFCSLLCFIFLLAMPLHLTVQAAESEKLSQFPLEVRLSIPKSFLFEMLEQQEAQDAYSLFCDHFRLPSGELYFPDSFAGETIMDGKLVIYLTDISEKTLSLYTPIFSECSDVVVFEPAQYSYNFLRALQSDIITRYPGKVGQCYVDVESNCVVVVTNSANSILSRSSIPTDALNIIESEELMDPELHTSLAKGGDTMYRNGMYNRTLAACGTYNGQPALLSCGHNGQTVRTPIGTTFSDASGSLMSTVVVSNYFHNYSGDYSISQLNTTLFTSTNLIINPNGYYSRYVGSLTEISNGAVLLKYGRTTGFSGLKVLDNQLDHNMTPLSSTPFIVNDLVMCRIAYGDSQSGDSGGPIMSLTDEGTYLAGTHVGHSPIVEEDDDSSNDEPVEHLVYFSPFFLIDDIFILNTNSEP